VKRGHPWHYGPGRTRRLDGGIASKNVKGIIGDHKEGRSETVVSLS
jgi:hypothetical protein